MNNIDMNDKDDPGSQEANPPSEQDNSNEGQKNSKIAEIYRVNYTIPNQRPKIETTDIDEFTLGSPMNLNTTITDYFNKKEQTLPSTLMPKNKRINLSARRCSLMTPPSSKRLWQINQLDKLNPNLLSMNRSTTETKNFPEELTKGNEYKNSGLGLKSTLFDRKSQLLSVDLGPQLSIKSQASEITEVEVGLLDKVRALQFSSRCVSPLMASARLKELEEDKLDNTERFREEIEAYSKLLQNSRIYKLVKYKLKNQDLERFLLLDKVEWKNWVNDMGEDKIASSPLMKATSIYSNNIAEYFWWWDTVHNYNIDYDYEFLKLCLSPNEEPKKYSFVDLMDSSSLDRPKFISRMYSHSGAQYHVNKTIGYSRGTNLLNPQSGDIILGAAAGLEPRNPVGLSKKKIKDKFYLAKKLCDSEIKKIIEGMNGYFEQGLSSNNLLSSPKKVDNDEFDDLTAVRHNTVDSAMPKVRDSRLDRVKQLEEFDNVGNQRLTLRPRCSSFSMLEKPTILDSPPNPAPYRLNTESKSWDDISIMKPQKNKSDKSKQDLVIDLFGWKVNESQEFTTVLFDLIQHAQTILDTPGWKLLSKSHFISEIVEQVRSLGMYWDKNPTSPCKNWYMKLLLALANLNRLAEWWEAERTKKSNILVEKVEPNLLNVQDGKPRILRRPMVRKKKSRGLSFTRERRKTTRRSPSSSRNNSDTSIDIQSDDGSIKNDLNSCILIMELAIPTNKIKYISSNWTDLAGISVDKMVNKDIKKILHFTESETFEEANKNFKNMKQENHLSSVECKFHIYIENNKYSLPSDNWLELTARGILSYDIVDGLMTPSISTWVLRPSTPLSLVQLELEEDYGLSSNQSSFVMEDISITPIYSPKSQTEEDKAVLCHICENYILADSFVPHSLLCSDYHRATMDIQICADGLQDFKSKIVDLKCSNELNPELMDLYIDLLDGLIEGLNTVISDDISSLLLESYLNVYSELYEKIKSKEIELESKSKILEGCKDLANSAIDALNKFKDSCIKALNLQSNVLLDDLDSNYFALPSNATDFKTVPNYPAETPREENRNSVLIAKSSLDNLRSKRASYMSDNIGCPLLGSRSVPPSIDDYKIIKPISKGAYGSVYLAKKNKSNEYYAIKILKKQDMVSKNQVSNIKAERFIMMSQPDNPFIVKLYCSFQTKDHLYLVMEYLNGGDCSSLLKAIGVLSEEWSRFYLAEVTMGLRFLHQNGIVHRDIKPDNLLIDHRGHLKLTDFGLSKVGFFDRQGYNKTTGLVSNSSSPSLESLCNTPDLGSNSFAPSPKINYINSLLDSNSPTPSNGKLVGTPDYLAPESILGTINIATETMLDWWSLGIMSYEFLVGVPPFNAPSIDLVFSNILTKQPQFPLQSFDPNSEDYISNISRDFTLKLLVKDCNQRLGTNGGAVEIQGHPIFNGINWQNLINETPEFIPKVECPEDTDYFDTRGAKQYESNETVGTKSGSSTEFGSFVYKNLSMLEKANSDVIKRLKLPSSSSSSSSGKKNRRGSRVSLILESVNLKIDHMNRRSSMAAHSLIDKEVQPLKGHSRSKTMTISIPSLADQSLLPPIETLIKKGLKVLVVDDNPIHGKIMETILRAKTQTTTVHSGSEAIRISLLDKFDILFMDFKMSPISGDVATKLIRLLDGPNRETPIVAVSSYEFLELGLFDDFIPKPVTKEVIWKRLRVFCKI